MECIADLLGVYMQDILLQLRTVLADAAAEPKATKSIHAKYGEVQKLYRVYRDMVHRLEKEELDPTLLKVQKQLKDKIVKLADDIKSGVEKLKKADVPTAFKQLAVDFKVKAKEFTTASVDIETLLKDIREEHGHISCTYAVGVHFNFREKEAKPATLVLYCTLDAGNYSAFWMKTELQHVGPLTSATKPSSYYYFPASIDKLNADDVLKSLIVKSGGKLKGKEGEKGLKVGDAVKALFKTGDLKGDKWIVSFENHSSLEHLRKETLHISEDKVKSVTRALERLAKAAAVAGAVLSGNIGFQDEDYYDNNGDSEIPSWSIKDNVISARSTNKAGTPKGWSLGASLYLAIPVDAKEKDLSPVSSAWTDAQSYISDLAKADRRSRW